jgi:predicted secreted protein
MAALSSNPTTFTWNSQVVANVVSASWSASGAEIDVTALAGTVRSYLRGKLDWTIELRVHFNKTQHGSTPAAGVVNLAADFTDGTARTFTLNFQDGSVSSSGIITAFNIAAEMDQAVSANLTIRGTGALTFPGS